MASLTALSRRQGPWAARMLQRNSLVSIRTQRVGWGSGKAIRHWHRTLPHATLSSRALDWLDAAFVPSQPRAPCLPNENEQQTILAFSPTALQQQEQRILRRLIRRIREWVQALYDSASVVIRSAEVAIRMSPLLVLTPAAILTSNFLTKEENKVADFAWWYTIRSLQALGPCFVKLAQWIATRRDIFPPNICDRFSKLHDRGFTHRWVHTHQALTDAFGPYEEKGLHMNKDDIIGCGSAAQVYRASLETSDGSGVPTHRTVAVKVLHPRFQSLVERDYKFMKSVADILNALPSQTLKMLNLPRVAENFGVILRRQADLRVEGENLIQFRKNFKESELESSEVRSPVFFPLPVEGWMDKNVLVEDLVQDAKPISDFLRDSSEEGWAIRKELAGPLLRAFLKMVFLDNFVHCDLHPGNVLVHTVQVPSPSSWWSTEKNGMKIKRTIVFLDAGIATSLNHVERKNLKDLFRAVILNDGGTAGRLMVERAKYERCSQVEGGVEAFSSGIEKIVSEFHDRRKEGLTLGAVRIGSLLSRVLDLCREHGVEVDPAMASIILSTMVLEGLGRSLEPNMNLIDCAVPFVLGRGQV